jgi:cytoskeletal protein RodZ
MFAHPLVMADNFGKQFTTAREALGLALGEIASKTKILEEYIETIERGDLGFSLPMSTFVGSLEITRSF